MHVSRRLRAVLYALGALTGLGVLAYAAHIALSPGPDGLDDFFQDWVYCGATVGAGVMCLLRGIAIRKERLAWILMGAGLLSWAGGDVTWTLLLANDPNPPYPSVSDFLYLAFYPASYASLLLVARSRAELFRSSLWLDGAIAALTMAAVIATLAFQPIVDATSGSPTEIAVNLA
jgi:diguanylate cyclase